MSRVWVEGPLWIELLFGRDLRLSWQLKPAEVVEVARCSIQEAPVTVEPYDYEAVSFADVNV